MRREVWKNQELMRGDWLRNDDELRRRATVRWAASVNDADAVNQLRSRRTPSAAEQLTTTQRSSSFTYHIMLGLGSDSHVSLVHWQAVDYYDPAQGGIKR